MTPCIPTSTSSWGRPTSSARRIEFTDVREVGDIEWTLRADVHEAIELEKEGREVERDQIPEPMPEELQQGFDASPELQAAFEALMPGRRREYILRVSGAKNSATRKRRVEKCVDKILAGKGLRGS